MSISISRSNKPLKLLAGTAVAALAIGWAAGIGAQAADPQQTSFPPLRPPAAAAPAPLGHDDIREVQNQLIALGYNPGPADGEAGPATTTAVQQYDHAHGGTGQAPIDSALLARLKADTGPRLSYEQVQERSHQQQAQASASGSNQLGGIVQQIVPLIGAAIANSNNNNYGPGYYGPGPGYYGPPPGYYGGY
jgi:peptidoglycan hydrolase-like protein with peptidoglycan-binding domain